MISRIPWWVWVILVLLIAPVTATHLATQLIQAIITVIHNLHLH